MKIKRFFSKGKLKSRRIRYFCKTMRKHYKYNPKTLSYEEVRNSLWKRVLRFLFSLIPGLMFGAVLFWWYSAKIDSPKEKALFEDLNRTKKELKQIREEIKHANRVLEIIQSRDENLYREILHAEPFPEEYRKMGVGGSDKYSYLEDLSNGELLKEVAMGIDKLQRKLYAQSISFSELHKLAKRKEEILSHIPAIQPIRNSDLSKAVGGYGWRIDPVYRVRKFHSGLDFTCPRGTEVYATGNGVIEVVENKLWGYGKSIVINHGYGYKTRYAHLSKINVKEGQKVKRGELIGNVGSTGKSTGPHLHYEVIVKGEKVNPIAYFHSDLTPEQYEELLEKSKASYQSMD